jgi:hypothetical protein
MNDSQHKPLTTTEDNTQTTNEILQKQRLQEGNNAQALLLPDRRSWVFTLKKVQIFKTMPSSRSLSGTTNEGQTLGFHPENRRLSTRRAPSRMQSTYAAATPTCQGCCCKSPNT